MGLKTLLIGALVLAGCGGGGDGPVTVAFSISGSAPPDGAVDVSTSTPLTVVFTVPVDLGTVDVATLKLERQDGTTVAAEVVTQNHNKTSVRLSPTQSLEENERYRLVVKSDIRSAEGDALGEDHHVCFITESRWPTVRPDQVVDLGDRLNVPRYEARSLRATGGRVMLFGGYSDRETVTDTIEYWDTAAKTFRLHAGRMLTPRAEHTVTLLGNGSILIAGGVSEPGGEPLASTEFFDPYSGASDPGPDLTVARRWHGASLFIGATSVMVSGGYGFGGDALDSIETLEGDEWRLWETTLPEPTAQHIQEQFGIQTVYFGSGNFDAMGAYFNGTALSARLEGDIRFRPAYVHLSATRIFVVGGDTRSILTYEETLDYARLATGLLNERRGAHTLTPRDESGTRFLVAGGFNIAQTGSPPLRSLEIVDALDPGPYGFPDARAYRVENVELPVPFAGHAGFQDGDGATVLAGGFAEGTGEHSRRVVIVHTMLSAPPFGCTD